MKFPLLFVLKISVLCSVLSSRAIANAEAPTVPALPQIFSPGSTILFQGDSITDGLHKGDMNHVYGHGYVCEIASRYQALHPEWKLQFANRGISGNTSSNLVERWAKDAFPYAIDENGYEGALGRKKGENVVPDWLSVLVGINDYFYYLRKTPNSVSVADYEKNLRTILAQGRAANPKLKLVLCEPFRIPVDASPEFCRRQDVVAKLAAEYDCAFVPFQKLFGEDLLKRDPNPCYWFWDFFHPTPAGHYFMADFWIESVRRHETRPRRNTALEPRAQLEADSYDWYARHESIVKKQKELDPEIVFIGDSITHGWEANDSLRGDAKAVFDRYFGKMRPLNMGFGWDRIQNVLWRLSHGEMDGLKPKVVVIHIGSNNTAPGVATPFPANTPDEIAEGIVEVCRRVREKAPAAKIVLMNVFPRGSSASDARQSVVRVNESLGPKVAALHDTNLIRVNAWDCFVGDNGEIPKTLMFDALHPTAEGYERWGQLLQSVVCHCASVDEDKAGWMMQTNAFQNATTHDDADLPNVLVLGDSISIGYTPFLQKRLAGVANVHRPKSNCASTQFYLRKSGGMRDWVGTNKWDVITVNCGIWDLTYIRGDVLKTDHYWGPDEAQKKMQPLERGTSIRANGFRTRTPIVEYAASLKEILKYLKSTGATVVFALTTPCRDYQYDDRCGLECAYNEVASAVSAELGINVVDLYSVGERHCNHQPDRIHFDAVGNDALAEALGEHVKKVLAARVSLEEKIAARHPVLVSDEWGGGHRIIFDFNGRRGWVVEPKAGVDVAGGCPWVWTMQWMGAYLNRTGAPDLVRKGWYHVHLDAFDTRANAEGLKVLAAFQDYLVQELGFAPRANLIGMSWGGFYSVRYANAYPAKVAKIYLDAPLLNFEGFGGNLQLTPTAAAAQIGPWAKDPPADGDWSADPRMPVNMAASIAAAKIPVYLLYGGQDRTVNPDLNCERFIPAFQAAGGDLNVEKRGLYGHHPHGFEHEDLEKICSYFEQ